MNARQRFIETMRYGAPDRPPLFAEGLREGVLKAWQRQGLPRQTALSELFLMDERQEIEPDFWPSPYPSQWPTSMEQVEGLKRWMDPEDPKRLPKGWRSIVKSWSDGQQVRMLFVHHGFFESVGVEGWSRFYELMFLLKDAPQVVQRMMDNQGEFNARIIERVLSQVQVEAAVISEPIGGNHGPLISPRLYAELVLPSYRPILDVLRRHKVETIILRTYANARVLIPALLKAGINCLWAVEVFGSAMDYRELRREFGRDLRLIGGIDLDVLYQDRSAIQRELEEKVPPLLAQGGYAPLADGRVREGIPWVNYRFYRELLQRLVTGS